MDNTSFYRDKQYFDFLLTACYDCEQDIGISFAWDAEEIKEMNEKLLENKEKLEDMPLPDDLMYDMEPDELFDAYDDLCDIYKKAEKEGMGILFTF